jgi:hypothetical protein
MVLPTSFAMIKVGGVNPKSIAFEYNRFLLKDDKALQR